VVDRKTRCILGWAVVWVRTREAIQLMLDDAPKAKWYYSDGFDAYQWLWYHLGRYEVSLGKSETYSVEGDNSKLRHYLARLARRSRCFSRCPYALEYLSAYLSTHSMADNFTNNNIQITPPT
jgi:insertion element IS1 protein InsB